MSTAMPPGPAHPDAPSAPRASLADWAAALRPRHWLKNVFVFAPALFSEHVTELGVLTAALLAVAWFCPLASAVYLVNDVADRATDARHPRKRNRPIPAGRIGVGAAIAAALLLAAVGIGGAAVTLPTAVAGFMAAYLANTLVYIFWLKHRVIADVLSICIGFVLRLLAGCAAVGVEPSEWLLVCGFSLAMVLGFGKRRAEVGAEGVTRDYRSTLISYDRAKLDTLLGVSTAVCLLAYILFTVAPDTFRRHGTTQLMYTVPIVAYGLFRYVFKAQEAGGDGPTQILVNDPVFAITGLLWGAAVAAILTWS